MLYLFLIAVWPILNYVEANFFKLNNYSDVLVILGTSLVFSCLVGNLIKKYSKDPIERYLFVFFVLSASFFYYAHFVDALKMNPLWNSSELNSLNNLPVEARCIRISIDQQLKPG